MRQYLRDEGEIRDLLVKYMIEKELSEAEIAREIGLAYGTMQRFLRGTGKPYFTTIVKISKFLDVC